MTPDKGKKSVSLVSLGCDKNLVDSEKILAFCKSAGYELLSDPAESDVIVVNTCCFIDDAKSESIETILDLASLKNPENGYPKIVVAGCMAKRYHDEILAEIPEVDAVCDGLEPQKVAIAVGAVLSDRPLEPLISPVSLSKRINSSFIPYSFLKIADGCNKGCTYCSIPSIRGTYRSEPIDLLIEEAKELADNGVKELNIVAQETTLYGLDLYGKKSLHNLLPKLCKIEGIEWLRLLYCYPEEIDGSLLDIMRSENKILHYLDIPIQHASDNILKKMGRHTSHDDIIKIIHKIREKIPDVALRTTFITGFPGETEEDFLQLCDFVREIKFEHVGVFCYSRQEGTPADKMQGHISSKLAESRKNALLELQQTIKLSLNAQRADEELPCLVEGYDPKRGLYVTRTYRDAPEVDSFLYLKSNQELMTGDIINAKVIDYDGYDLLGSASKKI